MERKHKIKLGKEPVSRMARCGKERLMKRQIIVGEITKRDFRHNSLAIRWLNQPLNPESIMNQRWLWQTPFPIL
jgi:hypothetical protein